MMGTEKFPARLHVLLARDRKFGVVIRRGPSKYTCVLSWDRAIDEFKVAQWLKGRIYERRSDLSPDGSYMIYFAMNGKWDSEAKGAWTAISRAPWLKAVALFAKGDCWNGGGLFISNKSYWLNDGPPHVLLYDTNKIIRDTSYSPPAFYGGECLSVYYNRLQRDGWTLMEQKGPKLDSLTIFEKKLPKGWIVKKIAHEQVGSPEGKGCYWDEHELIRHDGDVISCPDWEWAEWTDNRLCWAKEGCLYSAGIKNRIQFDESKLLHDFNDHTFEELTAPY